MLYFKSIAEAQNVFKALSAPARLQIMQLIYENDSLSMNDLAETLQLTNSAISMHVGKLVDADLVYIKTTSGRRGTMKLVRPRYDRLMIDLAPCQEERLCYQDEIRVGQYTSCNIAPTCGLATPSQIIGAFDDPRVFSFPERFDASILWFGSGYVEYTLPNHLLAGQKLTELHISFEISSECPGYNEDYPSDIFFSINAIPLGTWISPGDFGARKGYMCPSWWPDVLNQYGLLKTLIINGDGTFIDGGSRIADTRIDDLHIDYTSNVLFRVSVPRDAVNCGGCTLFGESFGDYNQALVAKAFYTEEKSSFVK